jgi:hypothetical protein
MTCESNVQAQGLNVHDTMHERSWHEEWSFKAQVIERSAKGIRGRMEEQFYTLRLYVKIIVN